LFFMTTATALPCRPEIDPKVIDVNLAILLRFSV